MYALRSIARVPMNWFNIYGALPKKHPQAMNYYVHLGVIFFVTVAGKGAEKFSMVQSHRERKFYKALLEKQHQLDAQN